MKYTVYQFTRLGLFLCLLMGMGQAWGQTAGISTFPSFVCENDTLSAQGSVNPQGNTDYTYAWKRVDISTSIVIGSDSLAIGLNTVYLDTVIDASWNNDTIYLCLLNAADSVVASEYRVISVTTIPDDITITSSDTTICPGEDITLAADNTGSEQVFWYDNQNGASIGTGNSFSATNITQSTTYFARSENDCGNSNWESVTITVYDDPDEITSIDKDPNIGICQGEAINLTPDGDTEFFEEVRWYDAPSLNPGSFLGTGDPFSITFTQNTTAYAIRVNTICPTLQSASRSVDVEVVPAPLAVIHDSNAATVLDTLTVCVGDSLTFYPDSSMAGNNSTFSWSKNGNVTLTNIEQNGIVAIFNTAGERSVTLTVDEGLSCDGIDIVVVKVLPLPNPQINLSDRDICSGESVTFSISPEDDVDYTWTYAGNQTSTAISVDFLFIDPVSPIVVTASNGACSVEASDTVLVTTSPIANIGDNGGDQTCVGIPIDLYAATELNSSDVTYTWNTGGGIPQSSASDSLSVMYDTEGLFEVMLVAIEGDCEARDTFAVSVVSTPLLSLNGVQLMDSVTILNIAEMSSTPIMLSSNLAGAEITWELSLDSGSVSNNFQEAGIGNITEIWELASGVSEAKIKAIITVGLIGCESRYEVILIIKKALFIPDIISPNGDGFNDTWNIELLQDGESLADYIIELHHRQGQCIYGCSSLMTLDEAVVRDWSELADGPYFYLILGPDDFMTSGPVTIVR